MESMLVEAQAQLLEAQARAAQLEDAMDAAAATALAERDAFWKQELALTHADLTAAQSALQVSATRMIVICKLAALCVAGRHAHRHKPVTVHLSRLGRCARACNAFESRIKPSQVAFWGAAGAPGTVSGRGAAGAGQG